VSSVVSTSAMDPIFDTDGTTIIGYSDTDSFGTTTYYDLNGIVTGSSYSYTNWDGSVSVTHYNAAGTWIGSETRDASGNLMYSTEYNYDGSGNFTGATYINVDTWNGTTTTSTMDANWHNLSSVTINNSTDAVVYSTTYHYEGTDGAYSGYTYFDGVTEWVYDAFGSLISGGVADVLGENIGGAVEVRADRGKFGEIGLGGVEGVAVGLDGAFGAGETLFQRDEARLGGGELAAGGERLIDLGQRLAGRL